MPFTVGLFMQSYNFYTMPTPPVGTLPLDGFMFALVYSCSKVWLAFTLSIEEMDSLVELSPQNDYNYCSLIVIFYLKW
jgi:hypothetical protein